MLKLALCALLFSSAVAANSNNANPFDDMTKGIRDKLGGGGGGGGEYERMENTMHRFTQTLPEHQALAMQMMPVVGTLGALIIALFCAGCFFSCLCDREMREHVHKPVLGCCSRALCWPYRCSRGSCRKMTRCARYLRRGKRKTK